MQSNSKDLVWTVDMYTHHVNPHNYGGGFSIILFISECQIRVLQTVYLSAHG